MNSLQDNLNVMLNGVLTVLLASWVLNDLPHAAGLLDNPNYDRPPTPGQLRYIAALTQELHITEPHVETFGEAGRMIRELEEEKKHRKRLKKGSPGNPKAARHFTHEVYEDFYINEFHPRYADPFSPSYQDEAFPDTSQVDDAVNLLSRELYGLERSPILVYREPSGKPLGYAVYQTGFNKIIGVNALDIFLIGSLSDESGIGTQIMSELTNVATGQHLEAITATAKEPGLVPFYTGMGFTECPGRELGMVKWLKGGNPTTATGTCYRDAWRYVIHHTDAVLVHGSIVGLSGRMKHAWAELPDGTVWDPSSQATMPIERYYSLVDPIVEDRYTADEAAHMLSVGKHGPWTAEERMKHIGR